MSTPSTASPPPSCGIYRCPCIAVAVESTPTSAAENSTASSTHTKRSAARLLQTHELSWQEQLFRHQYSHISISTLLTHITSHLPRAISLYLTYYHFRVRGYELHDGIKLGVDYVAYPPGGAERWHAQYAILVGELEEIEQQGIGSDSPPMNASFQHVMRTMHICVKQKKTCLYVRTYSTRRKDEAATATTATAASADVTAAASSSTSSSLSSSSTLPSPASDLSGYSVSVMQLRNWFVTKGRQIDNRQDNATSSGKKHKLQQQQQTNSHEQQPQKKQKLAQVQ